MDMYWAAVLTERLEKTKVKSVVKEHVCVKRDENCTYCGQYSYWCMCKPIINQVKKDINFESDTY
tara:strand:+ start:576 stop:770 length:195 start_codon:yes stop_codon:yes gene_type:complete